MVKNNNIRVSVSNPKRRDEDLLRSLNGGKISSQKVARHFARQTSEWQPKVFIKTFGCQMNSRDSEALSGLLRDKGFALIDDISKADVILFNTCSVRQHAEDKAWSELGRLKPSRYRKTSQNAKLNQKLKPIIGVIGCMAQNYKEEIFKRMPHVDMVVGPNDLLSIPLLIEAVQKEKSNPEWIDLPRPSKEGPKGLAVGTMERLQDFYVSNFRQEKGHGFVVISEGCSNFCSYCVVPFVRGRIHSRNYKDILDEIKRCVDLGIKDITLLGQNVNSYRNERVDFVKLLKMVNDIEGLEQFSFLTSHPKDTSVELFTAMRDLKKVKKQLHLPVQSGSDRILKMMNRGYTVKQYLELVDKYRQITAGTITTDIIVGFPGETESDFNLTYDLMCKAGFNAAYIFKYSPRTQTEAEGLKDDVPQKEKESRHKILLDLQKGISKKKKCA